MPARAPLYLQAAREQHARARACCSRILHGALVDIAVVQIAAIAAFALDIFGL
jgi:hypothetical protein